MIHNFFGIAPEISPKDVYIAPNATLISRVRVLENASIWFGAVLRGDSEWIEIGIGSNIQDNAVLHTDPGFPLIVGPNVTVGHLAMLHGCIVGEGSMIGMGSTIMNGCRIGRNCLIGARTLLTEMKNIPDGSVVHGSPGKIVGNVTPAQLTMLAETARSYQIRASAYLAWTNRPAPSPSA